MLPQLFSFEPCHAERERQVALLATVKATLKALNDRVTELQKELKKGKVYE